MEIAVLLLMILVSGLFAMSEIAVVSSKRVLLEAAAERGDRLAAAALRLTNNPTQFLSTVQVGITLATLLTGALGEAALARKVEAWLRTYPAIEPYAGVASSTLVVIAIGYVSLVIGELVPKRIGMTAPEPIARFIAPPMRVLSILTAPLVKLLSSSTNVILRIFGITAEHEENVTEEEIKGLIEKGTEAGVFQEAEQELVERVFRLGDQQVRELMVPRNEVDWLDADAPDTLTRIAIAASSRSHFPVCRGGLDNLVGVVHVKDLVKNGLLTDQIDLVAIAQKPLFVPEAMPALKALETFRRERVHIAFVLDEYGTMEGLITLNDIVEGMFGEMLRAGEEHDPMMVRRADGSWLLDGMLPVEKLKELIERDSLPNEDSGFQTVGGFLMTALARVPQTGDIYAWDRFTIEVVDMDRQRVDKVLLTIAREEIRVDENRPETRD